MDSYLVSPVTRRPFSDRRASNGTVLDPNTAGLVLTSLGAATVSLPPVSASTDGNVVAVQDFEGVASTNPITVSGNGRTIDGASTCVLNTDNAVAVFVLDGGVWRRNVPLRVFQDGSGLLARTTELGAGGGGAPAGTGLVFTRAGSFVVDSAWIENVGTPGRVDVTTSGYAVYGAGALDEIPATGFVRLPANVAVKQAVVGRVIGDSSNYDVSMLSLSGLGVVLGDSSVQADTHVVAGRTVSVEAGGNLTLSAAGTMTLEATTALFFSTNDPSGNIEFDVGDDGAIVFNGSTLGFQYQGGPMVLNANNGTPAPGFLPYDFQFLGSSLCLEAYSLSGRTWHFGGALAGTLTGSPLPLGITAITKSTTADLTLSAAQSQCPILNISGTPGGAFNVLAERTLGGVYIVRNGTPSVLTFKAKGVGSGAGVTVAAGATRWVFYDDVAIDYRYGSG